MVAVAEPASGVPESGVPLSGVPLSGVPESGVPLSGVPESGVPLSGGAGQTHSPKLPPAHVCVPEQPPVPLQVWVVPTVQPDGGGLLPPPHAATANAKSAQASFISEPPRASCATRRA
jgi:hypothetical protein